MWEFFGVFWIQFFFIVNVEKLGIVIYFNLIYFGSNIYKPKLNWKFKILIPNKTQKNFFCFLFLYIFQKCNSSLNLCVRRGLFRIRITKLYIFEEIILVQRPLKSVLRPHRFLGGGEGAKNTIGTMFSELLFVYHIKI